MTLPLNFDINENNIDVILIAKGKTKESKYLINNKSILNNELKINLTLSTNFISRAQFIINCKHCTYEFFSEPFYIYARRPGFNK